MNQYVSSVCVVVVILLTGCDSNSVGSVKDFIPGAYVRPFETEFAVGVDSLVLQQETDNHYVIFKYSRFSRVMNNAALPMEEHTQKWKGAFDEKEKVIREFQGGKVISFNVEQEKLFVGTTEYKKVR